MIAASPHLYRKNAPETVSPEVVERAITQAAPPEAKGLPAILTLRHLSHLTGADYAYLRSIVSRERDAYRAFAIGKRSGGTRLIASPEPVLGAVQRWLAEKVLNPQPVHQCSFAYKPQSSPLKCAYRHLGAKWLVKIDIHDFFESISERRVYFAFLACGYQPLISFELARLCTRAATGRPNVGPQWSIERHDYSAVYPTRLQGHLPQGAPTSPMLSNLVSIETDRKMHDLAIRYGLTFTRYSDDLAFSASEAFTHKAARTLIAEAERLLNSFGHSVHHRKTTIAPPGARKVVLGLLVDGDRPRLSMEYRKRISDHVRGVEKFGLAAHASERHFSSIWGMVRHLYGVIAHVQGVEKELGDSLKTRLNDALAREEWDPVRF